MDARRSLASHVLLTDMDAHARNAVDKFQKACGSKLSEVASPYLQSEEALNEGIAGRVCSKSNASLVATLLFLARVARPDISVAAQGLCRVVTKWTTTHDGTLGRLCNYFGSTGAISLVAELDPDDLLQVQVCLWSQADLL